MGFYEDERIRRKNKEHNPAAESVPILSPAGGSDEENIDISSRYVTDGDAAAEKCKRQNPYHCSS
jgi:hypothetical protein